MVENQRTRERWNRKETIDKLFAPHDCSTDKNIERDPSPPPLYDNGNEAGTVRAKREPMALIG